MSTKVAVLGAGTWGASVALAASSVGAEVRLLVSWSARPGPLAAGIGGLKRGLFSRVLPAPAGLAAMEMAAIAIGAPLRYGRLASDPGTAALLKESGADLLLVACWPNLVPGHVLEAFPSGGINAHPSLLPAHKGPHPLKAALAAGDREVGVTLHRMTPVYDEGEILWQRALPVEPGDSPELLMRRLLEPLSEGVRTLLRPGA